MDVYDLIGVGVGPANLSLAALLQHHQAIKAVFLEKKASFSWHEGSTSNKALLQSSFIKDLVTMVEPTNKYSFLNYLVETGRIYAFMNRRVNSIFRKEFNLYFQWASQHLDNIVFSHNVEKISHQGKFFQIETNKNKFYAKSIVLACGVKPNIPDGFSTTRAILHSSAFNHYKPEDFLQKSVTVIGGGQSGAEVLEQLLQDNILPTEINWITDRHSLFTLQDSSFDNELYTPGFNRYFYGLSKAARKELNENTVFSSDGITEQLSNDLYNKIYSIKYILNQETNVNIKFHTKVLSIDATTNTLMLVNLDTQQKETLRTDIIILATGYVCRNKEALLKFGLQEINIDKINADYFVALNNDNRVYIQNGCRDTFGHADVNLSLVSWRNGKIINSLLGYEHYKLHESSIVY